VPLRDRRILLDFCPYSCLVVPLKLFLVFPSFTHLSLRSTLFQILIRFYQTFFVFHFWVQFSFFLGYCYFYSLHYHVDFPFFSWRTYLGFCYSESTTVPMQNLSSLVLNHSN
jgi:hypothetical protein